MADGRHAISLITPLAVHGRAEEVALRVGQAIRLGLLSDGEQLLPEAEFAAQLGVSAMTLREALAMLRQQGLVETRRGRAGGTFVRRPTAPQLGLLRDRLRAMSIGELRDLTDEQRAVSALPPGSQRPAPRPSACDDCSLWPTSWQNRRRPGPGSWPTAGSTSRSRSRPSRSG
jgi:DNA-binding transcriptional regulator YhcF (GntR family)